MQFFIKKAGEFLHGMDMSSLICSALYTVHLSLYVGCSLTGAGGGGFLAAILKAPEYRERVTEIIRGSPVRLSHISTHKVTCDVFPTSK